MLTLVMLTASAPIASASTSPRIINHQIIAGRVLKIDMDERQMLVAERSSKKLYLVNVPEGVTFKVTFGRSMQMSASGLEDVDRNNRVELRITRTQKEHFARLYDGREVIEVNAAH